MAPTIVSSTVDALAFLDDLSPAKRRKLIAILRPEQARRQAKAAHSAPGGLIKFVRYFWSVLEPETELVDGWPLEAICEHLEAVTAGEITRLLMTVPPGFMKSLLCDVFWPAWEWGPMGLAHHRYVAFSYSAGLTERDNDKFRTLVASPQYQALYGPLKTKQSVELRNKTITKVMNTKTGWKLASSVGGVGTGERGDRIICFPYSEIVATEAGYIPIGDIVEKRLDVRVWSYNQRSGQFELKSIYGWHKNCGRPLVKVKTSDGGSLACTCEHEVLTPTGYVRADQLATGDRLLAAPSRMFVAPSSVVRSEIKVQVSPNAAVAYAGDVCRTDVEFHGELDSGSVVAGSNLAHHFLGKVRRAISEGSVSFAVRNVLCARSILKIAQGRVGSVPILMAHLLSFWARAKECLRNHLVYEPIFCFAVQSYCNAWVPLIKGRGKFTAWDGKRPTQTLHYARDTTDSAVSRDLVKFVSDDRSPEVITVSSVNFVHEIPSFTYCLTVADNHNMVCGGVNSNIICSNCDDLHNVKEAESETVRNETVRWFRESVSTRFNDMDKGALIVIMQRLHEDDVAGVILSLGLDYTHLMIPWEYDSSRQVNELGEPVATSIGWTDPRYDPDDPHGHDGEPAWPERFSERAMAALRTELGPYSWAGQMQQSPQPRGGGIFQRSWWQPWQPADGKFPLCDYVIASLDSAFTEKEENDPSALTVFGVFTHPETKQRGVIMIDAWRKWLKMHGEVTPRSERETPQIGDTAQTVRAKNIAWKNRVGDEWGLVEWAAYTCRLWKVDKLLIEGKASGITAADEIVRLHAFEDWSVQLVPVKGDKVARALREQPIFSQGMVWAPLRDWAEMVIDEMATFPKSKHDDLTDSVTQAIKYVRDNGLLQTAKEVQEAEFARVRHRSKLKPLYAI